MPTALPIRINTFEHGTEVVLVLSYAQLRAPKTSSLTRAEEDVTRLLLSGRSNASIAEQRKTSIRTVCNQVASIFKKLGVSSRLELARKLDTFEGKWTRRSS